MHDPLNFAWIEGGGARQVRVDGVVVFACDHVTEPLGSVIEPKLAQGAQHDGLGIAVGEIDDLAR